MGHCCQIITISADVSKEEISKACGLWATGNCDLEERNGHGYDHLDIKFTDLTFDCFEDAEEYLLKTFGNYDQTAVRYKSCEKKDGEKSETKWAIACEVHC